MKKFTVFLCASFLSIGLAVGLMFLTAPAEALPVWGTSADLGGTRWGGDFGGVTVDFDGGPWDSPWFTIAWSITQLDTFLWKYVYTISTLPVGGPEISHFILEITEDDAPFQIFYPGSDPFDEIKIWEESGGSALLNPFYGVKFDFGGPPLFTYYTLITNRDPVWGVFWAKGGIGKEGEVQQIAYASALGFADYRTNETLSKFDFIARPDSFPIPEPATMLLLGAGLIGLAGLGRKKFLKRG